MFFTVKRHLKIAGKYFRPCICYPLFDYLLATVRELEAKGVAEITEEVVFFQNGAKIDAKELERKAKEAKNAEKERKKAERAQKKAEKERETLENEASSDETEASSDETAENDSLEGF